MKYLMGILVLTLGLLAESLLSTISDDPDKNRKMGDKALEEGQYSRAEGAYERCLIITPENIDCRLGIIDVFIREKLPSLAQVHLLRIPDYGLTEAQSSRLESLSSALGFTIRHQMTAYFAHGIGFDTDSNKGQSAKVYSPRIPHITLLRASSAYRSMHAPHMYRVISQVGYSLPDLEETEEDYYHGEQLFFGHRYNASDSLNFQTGVIIDRHSYLNNGRRSALYPNIVTGPDYTLGDFSVYFPFSYGYMIWGHDDFFQNYGFSPKITYSPNGVDDFELLLSWKRQLFIPESEWNRNSRLLMAGIAYEREFRTAQTLFRVETYLRKEEAEAEARGDINHRDYGINVELSKTFGQDIDVASRIGIAEKIYDSGSDWHDNVMTAAVSYSHRLTDYVTLHLNYGYTHSRSNFDPHDYSKQTYDVGFCYAF